MQTSSGQYKYELQPLLTLRLIIIGYILYLTEFWAVTCMILCNIESFMHTSEHIIKRITF